MLTRVTITHLEMHSASDLQAKPPPRPDAAVVHVPIAMPELNRFFYTTIGGDWYWLERLPWTNADWLKYVNRSELQTWLVTVAGVPAGYFELEKQSGDDVEIVYFGLLSSYTEAGLGGWALSQAVEKPGRWGSPCLGSYLQSRSSASPDELLARGFTIFKTETKEEDLPEHSGNLTADRTDEHG